MSNPSNSINVHQSLAAFRTAYEELFVTLKIDQKGKEVALENIREKIGQLWGNAADDMVLRLIQLFPRRFYDNRQAIASASRVPAAASAIATAGLGAAGQFDFTITTGLASGTMLWAKLVSSGGTPSADADLELFSDSGRTLRIYAAENVDPSTAFVEGTPAAMIPDAGGNLDGSIYGRITNNAGAASDFALELVLEGIGG